MHTHFLTIIAWNKNFFNSFKFLEIKNGFLVKYLLGKTCGLCLYEPEINLAVCWLFIPIAVFTNQLPIDDELQWAQY